MEVPIGRNNMNTRGKLEQNAGYPGIRYPTSQARVPGYPGTVYLRHTRVPPSRRSQGKQNAGSEPVGNPTVTAGAPAYRSTSSHGSTRVPPRLGLLVVVPGPSALIVIVIPVTACRIQLQEPDPAEA
eukprot:3657569-Rhodomonas_salina.1